MDPDDPISVYDRSARSEAQLEALLADGQAHRELALMFGDAEYARLAALARRAAARAADPGRIVYLLPGILGSQLGFARSAPPNDLLWLDPSDVIMGRLSLLALHEQRPLVPMGAIAVSYLPLKLELRAAGFKVRVHDYDWRISLADAGRRLAAELARTAADEIHLVAHSMGGLLARAALSDDLPARIGRLITVGTPHLGALAPVQALRGTYPTVRRLAALDRLHSAEQLASQVFSGFPSLYEMLPLAGALCAADLREPSAWPADEPRPDAQRLQALRAQPLRLAPLARCTACIAGTGQRTVTGLEREAQQFRYRITSLGDGTVPMLSAAPAGPPCWYATAEHSDLPRSSEVAQAIIELLGTGNTTRLRREAGPIDAQPVEVGDAELRRCYTEKIDWPALGNDARREYLNQLNLAPPAYQPPPR